MTSAREPVDPPTVPPSTPGSDLGGFEKLLRLVARLRAPEGCPWDREQTIGDLRAYLLEEAHELAAAIDTGEWDEIRDELGDLLFQVAFITRLAEEQAAFDAAEVVAAIEAKMIARHPHVFGEDRLATAEEVAAAWERRKLDTGSTDPSLLAGVPAGMPALLTSYRMTQKAAGVGFDWPDATSVVAKVREELAEWEDAETDGERREEIGDLLFAVANLARHCGEDPEAALAATNRKFQRRFRSIESGLAARGRSVADAELEEMDELWRQAKETERRT